MSEFNDAIQPESVVPANKKRTAKKVILITVLVFIVVGAVAGVGFANKMKGFHEHGKFGFMIDKITKDLDLTAQQKTDVDKIKEEIKTKMDAQKDSRKSRAEDFENLLRQSTLDKKQVLDMQSKHDAEREEMRSFMADEIVKFHDILTQDQRNKAADKIKDFREKRMKDGWKKHEKTNN